MGRQRKSARRVRVKPSHFDDLRNGHKTKLVTTTHQFFGGLNDGDTIVVYTLYPERSGRFRVTDHCRFETIAAVTNDHPIAFLADGIPEDRPDSHVFVVLHLEVIERVQDLARDKHPRHHPR